MADFHDGHTHANAELIIIICQSVMLFVSEVMPFLQNNKNGIVDGLVKIFKSECCENTPEDPIPNWVSGRTRTEIEMALKANEDISV